MGIPYQVQPNALTDPPSYSCRVLPKNVLDIDALAREINLHNPTIPVVTAKSVIEAFRDEVLYQLSIGNSVKVASFVSFVSTLPVRLANATDPLPQNAVDIKAKPSAPFKEALVNLATYERQEYNEKAPRVSSTKDTNTEEATWVRDNKSFRIDGSNLGFDSSLSTVGAWLVLADGTEVKQTSLALNNPSSVIITPSFESSLPSGEHVEVTLLMKNKYTENGAVRTGTLSNKIRATNTTFNLFSVAEETSPASITLYAGADVTCKIVSTIKPDGTLTMAIGLPGGSLGQVMDILEATASVVLSGLAGGDVTVSIDDYDSLYANVLAYQRYMVEMVALTATP